MEGMERLHLLTDAAGHPVTIVDFRGQHQSVQVGPLCTRRLCYSFARETHTVRILLCRFYGLHEVVVARAYERILRVRCKHALSSFIDFEPRAGTKKCKVTVGYSSHIQVWRPNGPYTVSQEPKKSSASKCHKLSQNVTKSLPPR